MEGVVELGAFWKLKVVGHLPDALQHLEGSCVAWPELPVGPGPESVGRSMKKMEPHPIPHRELELTMVGVVVVLGVPLILENTLMNLGKDVITVTQEGVHRLHLLCVAVGAVVGGHTPPKKEWRATSCGTKYCSNSTPMVASGPRHAMIPCCSMEVQDDDHVDDL